MAATMHDPQIPPQDDEMLSRYLDDDLNEQERQDVERLLAQSPEIRQQLESLRQTLSLMHSLPAVEAPPDFVQKVKRGVRKQRRHRFDQQPQFRIPYEILAVILVILMFVLYLLIQQHPSPPPPTQKQPTTSRPTTTP